MVDGPANQATEAEKAYPGERKTRLSGAWTALVIGVVVLVVILVFILQNQQSAEVNFLIFQGHLPLAVALLFAMVLGAVVVLAFGGFRILQLRLVARRARHRGPHVTPPAELTEEQ
ncbi:MAG: LapA family protein [Chloroflexi bacterium]|nr:MAG: LapA family protein [Chloroflexota bacterium]